MSLVEQVDGEMVAINHTKPDAPDYLRDKEAVWKQVCYHALERKGGNVEAAERFAKAQYRNLYGTWPRHAMRNITPEPPHPMLVRKIQQQIIRWAKGKQRAGV